MLGLSLKDFNKNYTNDLARLFSTITQAKDTVKVPQEYKGDKFDKFVAQLLNYTLAGNFELNEPMPKADIHIPHELFTNFFYDNPQFIVSFLYVLDYKDGRLKKLLKERYIGSKEERAVHNSLMTLTLAWSETGRSISDSKSSLKGKALFSKYVTGNGLNF